MPPKTKKKKKKAKAKVVKATPPVTNATKQGVGLTNWWDFNSNQNYGISNTNWNYINNEGLDVYSYARSKDYSVEGAALMMTLSARESGYGIPAAYQNSEDKNNFWGYKYPGTQTNKPFPNKEAGEHAGVDLVDTDSRYAGLKKLVRQDNVPVAKLDTAMTNYDHTEHPYDYATILHNDQMEGTLVRTLAAIGEKIKEIQNEIDAYNPDYVKGLKNTLPGTLNLQQQVDLNKLNQLTTEENKLKEIQKELQTGKKSDVRWFDDNAMQIDNQLESPYNNMFNGWYTPLQTFSIL